MKKVRIKSMEDFEKLPEGGWALENRNEARYDYHAEITREDAEDIERLATTLIEVLEREMESV